VCLQDVFNLLPNLGVEAMSRSFTVQSNDMMLAIYLAALTRSVLALHSLIDNKVRAQPTPGAEVPRHVPRQCAYARLAHQWAATRAGPCRQC
jgi:hypothetical protein